MKTIFAIIVAVLLVTVIACQPNPAQEHLIWAGRGNFRGVVTDGPEVLTQDIGIIKVQDKSGLNFGVLVGMNQGIVLGDSVEVKVFEVMDREGIGPISQKIAIKINP